jgi:uncharacterized protein
LKFFAPVKISENIRETPEGYLLCLGVSIARTGVMEYGEGETPLKAKNGKVQIHRSPEEVFRPETIASFEGKAVTITHPVDFVGPDNWSRLAKGLIQNVRRGEGDQKDDLVSDLLITDSTAIFLVKNGLRELSCGYEAEYEQTGDGEGAQHNIIGNHLALVDEGRAGSSYAINDRKGKRMTADEIKKKVKSIFAKAEDEATKVVDQASKTTDDDEGGEKKPSYDELVKVCNEMKDMISAMKPKDNKGKDDEEEEEKPKAKDDEEGDIESRLAALEKAVAKLAERATDDDEEEEESPAEDEEEEESTDEDPEMVGDSKSRAEILAPGIKGKSKDLKARALRECYATKEGKKVIDALNVGKKPAFDNSKQVERLFVSASEVLKVSRQQALADTRRTRDSDDDSARGPMTPEKLNEINAKFYANQK